jgi:hypothetical protein
MVKGEVKHHFAPSPEVWRVTLTADTEAGTVGVIDIASKKFVAASGATVGKACVTIEHGKAGDQVSALFEGHVLVESTAIAPLGQKCTFGAAGKVTPAGASPAYGSVVGYFSEPCLDITIPACVRVIGG